MIKATIETACGIEPDIEPKFNKGSAIRYFNAECGTISAIDNVEEALKIQGVQEISFVKNVGDASCTIGSSTDRVGFVIAQADTAEDAVKICEKVLEIVEITIIKGDKVL